MPDFSAESASQRDRKSSPALRLRYTTIVPIRPSQRLRSRSMRRAPLLVCLVCFLWIAANFALAGGKEKAPGKTGPSAKPAAAAKAKPAGKGRRRRRGRRLGGRGAASRPRSRRPRRKRRSKGPSKPRGIKNPRKRRRPSSASRSRATIRKVAGQDGPLGELRPTLAAVVERHGPGRRGQGGRRRMAADQRAGNGGGQDQRTPRRRDANSQGRQAGLRRTDHRRPGRVSPRGGLR